MFPNNYCFRTNAIKFKIIKPFGLLENKTIKIPYGVDLNKFKYRKNYRNNHPVKIVQVGRLTPKKGILNLIKSINLLINENSNFELNIIGDGNLKKDALDLVEKYKLNEKIKFHGAIGQEKVLVSTVHSGIPEAVEHNINGLLSEENNISELKNNLKFLIEDSDLRQKMGANGRKKIEEKFSLKKMAENYNEIYKNLLERN